jgi:hypothetical protein
MLSKIWLLKRVVNSGLVRVWRHDNIAKKKRVRKLLLSYAGVGLFITTKVVTHS